MAGEPEPLLEFDGSFSLIDREELEATAAIIAGLLLSGAGETYCLANDEWDHIYASTSPAFAVKVASEAVGIVADLLRLPANWPDARATTRRLERFHEHITTKYGDFI